MGHLRRKVLDFQAFENDCLGTEFIVLFKYELKNFALVLLESRKGIRLYKRDRSRYLNITFVPLRAV